MHKMWSLVPSGVFIALLTVRVGRLGIAPSLPFCHLTTFFGTQRHDTLA
jgi:hypothetical protein